LLDALEGVVARPTVAIGAVDKRLGTGDEVRLNADRPFHTAELNERSCGLPRCSDDTRAGATWRTL
jgi:hypothetical protein